jgi:hypothetical protein
MNEQNQGSTIASAAAGQPKAQEPTATITNPNQTTSRTTTQSKPQTDSSGTQARQTQSSSQPTSGLSFSAPAPTPTYSGGPDPRTPEYYANLQALQATFGAQLGLLQNEQDTANTRFNQESDFQNEYQRRRRRDLAESRLGSGSAYTGSARRERSQNDIDFAMEQARRNLDKTSSDSERVARLNALETERNQAIQKLDREFSDKLTQSLKDESETSAGDREFKPDYAARIKTIGGRITKLRGRLKKTDNPRKRAEIKAKIKELRKRRSEYQGKARDNG